MDYDSKYKYLEYYLRMGDEGKAAGDSTRVGRNRGIWSQLSLGPYLRVVDK
jgi:hypothetical protein